MLTAQLGKATYIVNGTEAPAVARDQEPIKKGRETDIQLVINDDKTITVTVNSLEGTYWHWLLKGYLFVCLEQRCYFLGGTYFDLQNGYSGTQKRCHHKHWRIIYSGRQDLLDSFGDYAYLYPYFLRLQVNKSVYNFASPVSDWKIDPRVERVYTRAFEAKGGKNMSPKFDLVRAAIRFRVFPETLTGKGFLTQDVSNIVIGVATNLPRIASSNIEELILE